MPVVRNMASDQRLLRGGFHNRWARRLWRTITAPNLQAAVLQRPVPQDDARQQVTATVRASPFLSTNRTNWNQLEGY